ADGTARLTVPGLRHPGVDVGQGQRHRTTAIRERSVRNARPGRFPAIPRHDVMLSREPRERHFCPTPKCATQAVGCRPNFFGCGQSDPPVAAEPRADTLSSTTGSEPVHLSKTLTR